MDEMPPPRVFDDADMPPPRSVDDIPPPDMVDELARTAAALGGNAPNLSLPRWTRSAFRWMTCMIRRRPTSTRPPARLTGLASFSRTLTTASTA